MSMSMIKCPSSLRALDDGHFKDNIYNPWRQKDTVAVVMGPTGTGKSKLSIDFAARFPAEIINSDKIQIYKGLDIVTNKVTEEEQRQVPHHLLGILPPNADFSAADFRSMALSNIESILNRGHLPIIVGGSNSYIKALIDDTNNTFKSRYDCCFLCMDVKMHVLHEYVSKRVDKMVEDGMVDEVAKIFDPREDYSKGIRRAIGVPEFDRYLRFEQFLDEKDRQRLLREAIQEMKNNTCNLACRQLEKIKRLQHVKRWKIHYLDATDVFNKKNEKEAAEAWDKLVVGPGATIVRQFINKNKNWVPATSRAIDLPAMRAALASAIH